MTQCYRALQFLSFFKWMSDKAVHIIERKKNEKCVFMKESFYLSMAFWKKKVKRLGKEIQIWKISRETPVVGSIFSKAIFYWLGVLSTVGSRGDFCGFTILLHDCISAFPSLIMGKNSNKVWILKDILF